MLKPTNRDNEEVTPETMFESAVRPEVGMEIEGLDMKSATDFRTFVVFFFLVNLFFLFVFLKITVMDSMPSLYSK